MWYTGIDANNIGRIIPQAMSFLLNNREFNCDYRSDILWRNANGAVMMWQMNGGTYTSSDLGVVNTYTSPNLGLPTNDWRIVLTGDYDGDGKSDILWRNNNGSGRWMAAGTPRSILDLSTAPGRP